VSDVVRTTQQMMQSVLTLMAFLARKNSKSPSHPRRRKGKGEVCGLCVKDKRTNIYCLGVPEMSMDSLMLRSIYSHVKEPLRKTLSQIQAINKRK
jgi:hypothetical protein